jgi:hypothetical protein
MEAFSRSPPNSHALSRRDKVTSTRACVHTNFSPSSAQRQQIKALLIKHTQALYWMTDGRHFVDSYRVFWNKDTPPDCQSDLGPILFSKDQECGGAGACSPVPCSGYRTGITVGAEQWCMPQSLLLPVTATTACRGRGWGDLAHNGFILAHEMGHCAYGLRDERYPGLGCGHSIMSGRYGHTNSYVYTNQVDMCDSHNGGEDPPPGISAHPRRENNWAAMHPLLDHGLPYRRGDTPDPFWAYTRPFDEGDGPFSSLIHFSEQ